MKETSKPRSLARRILRAGAIFLGAVVGLLLATACGAMIWVKTDSGERFVLRQVLTAVNGAIAGRLEIDHLRFTGFLRVEADAVRIFPPGSSAPAISTGQIDVDVTALALLRDRIEVNRLLIDRPKVYLLQDGDSTGLARAFASRRVAAPAPPTAPASFPRITLKAPSIQIRSGSFEMDGGWPFRLETLDIDIAADGLLSDIGITTSLRGRTMKPAARYLLAGVRGHVGPTGVRVASISLRIGQTILDASGALEFDLSKAAIALRKLSLAAADLDAFIPEAELDEDLQASGDATLDKQRARSQIALTLPAGHVLIDASLLFGGTFDQWLNYEAMVKTDSVALHTLRTDLPTANVTAALHISGKGLPTKGTSDISLDASGSVYEKLKADALSLVAHVNGMSAHVDKLEVQSADTLIEASGTIGLDKGDVTLSVDAPALRETVRLLTHGLGIKLPAMDGRLRLNATVGGPWANPHGSLAVEGGGILIGTTHVAGLRTSATLNDWTPDPRGSFSISATGVELKNKKCGDLKIAGAVDARHAHLDGNGQVNGNPANLTLRGEHHPGTAWTFGTFHTTVLSKTLASDTPFTIEYADGRLRIQGLNLSGDLGRLSLDADVARKGSIAAKLTIRGFHAENLPPILVPDGLTLAGTLNLSADVQGSVDNPVGNLRLTVDAARLRSLSNLSLNAHVHIAGMRAAGQLSATIAKGALQSSFDLPIALPADLFAPHALELPLKLAVNVSHVSLQDISPALSKPIPLLADIDGQLSLQGTTWKPVLTTNMDVENISYQSVDKGHVHAVVSYRTGEFNSEVDADRPASVSLKVTADVKLPLSDITSGRLLHDPNLTGEASVDIQKVDLGWLSGAGYGPSELAGIVSGTITAGGSPRKPHAGGQLAVSGLAVAGYHNVEAHLNIGTTDRITVQASAQLSGKPAVTLDASFASAPERVAGMTLADWLSMPFTLHVALAPTATDLLIPTSPAAENVDPPAFRGIASGVVDASGSANDPKVHLRLTSDETATVSKSTGTFTATVDYEKGHLNIMSNFESKSAGTLSAVADMSPDLGASALLKAGSLATGISKALARPANITVDTTNFNIAMAEGLSGSVYRLGGVMDMHVRKTGPLVVFGKDNSLDFAATLAGLTANIALEKGRGSMLGYGSFAELAIKASIHGTSIEMTDIEGKSGKGSFHGNLSLAATGTGEYKGFVQMALKSFPIEEDFQTRGMVSLQIVASGTGGHGRIDIPRIELRGGHAIIPDRIPRNIQSMEPNAEITFTDAQPKKESRLEKAAAVWVLHIGEVVIPDDFIVDAPLGAQLKLGAQLAVASAPPGGPPIDLTGSIHVVEGHITLLRRFDVDDGKLTFIAGHPSNPEVLVKAHYDGPDATVRITLSGTIDDLQRSFESTPQMSENDILSYLATGQRPTAAQSSDPTYFQGQLTDAAISALGAAAIGVVHGAVGQFLPGILDPDVLSVQTNVARGGLGPIRAGKFYLKGKLYVGGQYNPTANPLLNENQYEGEGDYRLGASESLRLIVGTEGHDSLYFMIDRSFETAKQKKQDAR